MEDLIQQLKDKAGLTEEQAVKTLHTIKEYIQSKLPPMMHGMIDNFLGNTFATDATNEHEHFEEEDILEKAKKVAKEGTEKIEDLAAEANIEGFAKEASDNINVWAAKAEDAAKEAIDKLKDMLGDEKQHPGQK